MQVDNLPPKSATSSRVRYEILHLLPSGRVTRQAVAKTMAMSVRTLQRRLSEDNTTFDELVDDVRATVAREMIRTQTVTIAQTAFTLGFTSVPAFHRAFVRWTAVTPGEFRNQRQQMMR